MMGGDSDDEDDGFPFAAGFGGMPGMGGRGMGGRSRGPVDNESYYKELGVEKVVAQSPTTPFPVQHALLFGMRIGILKRKRTAARDTCGPC
eukprot:SAG11_NODE_1782_length_4261_cov_2.796732_7_plen_91_part_00